MEMYNVQSTIYATYYDRRHDGMHAKLPTAMQVSSHQSCCTMRCMSMSCVAAVSSVKARASCPSHAQWRRCRVHSFTALVSLAHSIYTASTPSRLLYHAAKSDCACPALQSPHHWLDCARCRQGHGRRQQLPPKGRNRISR